MSRDAPPPWFAGIKRVAWFPSLVVVIGGEPVITSWLKGHHSDAPWLELTLGTSH